MPEPTFNDIRTLDGLLEWRRIHQSDRPAFAYLDANLTVAAADTYGSLAAHASELAGRLLERGISRQPVVLACPPGLDFVRALWGIWMAGSSVVPAYPPSNEITARRLRHILRETGASVIVAARDAGTAWNERLQDLDLKRLVWLEPSEELRHAVSPPQIAPVRGNDTALIQYTSGSIGAPKGVILTHRNILANSQKIYRAFIHTSKSRGLIWLPPYHDMGLLGGIVQPVYGGFRTCLMAPRTFLRNPLNWLRAIALSRATTSGGPDSAYRLCLNLAQKDVEEAGLKLNTWEVAFTGAEPVSPATILAFARKFESSGFQLRRFLPCYGLAEATLFVSGALKVKEPAILTVDRASLRRNEVRVVQDQAPGSQKLISSGTTEENVRIVHPEELSPCPATVIGEICVTGDSVARGYQNGTEHGDTAFNTQLDPGGPQYLRTGDLGFLNNGELYVTGRLKDLVNIRGQNHYPEDLEATIRSCRPDLAVQNCAAFSVTAAGTGGVEQLAVVQEVPRQSEPADWQAMADAIRAVIPAAHGISASTVVLIPHGRLPRTLSGKIQRSECREKLLAGTLEELFRWTSLEERDLAARDESVEASAAPIPALPALADMSPEDRVPAMSAWLIELVSGVTQIPPDVFDPNTHFGLYGLDSLTAAQLTAIISETLGVELAETSFWDYPNFDLLAKQIVAKLRTETAVPAGCV